MKSRRKFDKSFKLEVVRRSLDGITIKQLSEELDISYNVIGRWRRQYLKTGQDSFPGEGKEQLTAEQQQIRQLKKDLADANLETEILKKAIRIFSKSDGKSMNS